MFTGIIEELGEIIVIEPQSAGSRIRVRASRVVADAKLGDSIAVNGVCLTAVELSATGFVADMAPETVSRTNLGNLKPGTPVNLERPMRVGGRLDGHIVQGHVDGTGELLELKELGSGNWWLAIRVPAELERYLVFKGSVAVDGISLTVAALEGDRLAITIIPHTYQATNLRTRRTGDRINLECDIVAKYVEKMMGRIEKPSGLTSQKLQQLGY